MAKYIKTEDGYKPMTEVDLPYLLKTNPRGTGSFSLNRKTGTVIGINSHAEGNNTTASGDSSHAEGSSTTASGNSSHAEGVNTIASGGSSHAEGSSTTASGAYSHAEGGGSKASKNYSHAEGVNTTASGACSHAEGNNTKASGSGSHAEGNNTNASGVNAHAEGVNTTAFGSCSHAEGVNTKASGKSTHVQGEFNIDQGGNNTTRSTYAHIVGNGTSNSSRSNAHTLDWSGNAWFAGNVKIGGSGQNDARAKTLATVDDIQILAPKSTTITLAVADWIGNTSPYSQAVTVDGITAMSKIDLQPTPEQLLELQESAVTLMIVNDNGIATAYAIGFKPTKDYTMKILITETR